MEQKFVTGSLFVVVALLAVFIGTFGWFMVAKERVCAVNLNSPACGESYQAFMVHKLGR
jgi:hypothetical protein